MFVQSMLLGYQPGFAPKLLWIHIGLALTATLVARVVLWRPTRYSRTALTQWAVGLTLFWALMATLWVPFFDAGKSYRAMILSVAGELPGEGCVASLHLGEPQRGLFAYFAQVTTERLELAPDVECKSLLVQGWRATGAPAPSPDWIAVWGGARPGDNKEFYRLYRKDVTPSHAVVTFP